MNIEFRIAGFFGERVESGMYLVRVILIVFKFGDNFFIKLSFDYLGNYLIIFEFLYTYFIKFLYV